MDNQHEGSAADTGFDLAGFMRALAHEIANPLNALTMNSELMRLMLDRGDAQRARDVLERLITDCARCAKVTRELQKFGSALRAQAPETVALRALLDNAVTGLSLEYAGHIPQFELAADDATIATDRAALERAITALLRNSAEAGAQHVTLDAHRAAGAVLIDVRDDGPGIADAERARATEAFFTTRRTEGGVGLGLVLVRELLRRCGSTLALHANRPRGLHVQLRLPG